MPSNKSTNLCLSHQSSTIPRIKQDDKNQRGSQVETVVTVLEAPTCGRCIAAKEAAIVEKYTT